MPRNKGAGNDTWADPNDAPELTNEFFERAELREGEKLIRRGRPKLDAPKQQVTVRLDADVLDGLRATGPGWQTRMNEALRQWLSKPPISLRSRGEAR